MLKNVDAPGLLVPRDRRSFDGSIAARLPGVAQLAAAFQRLADLRVGRVPVGLVALLPVALFLDFFDAADELFLGPVGMAVSFLLETGFLLGLTGRATYAFGFAGIDLIPGVDIIPFATLTLVREIARAWNEDEDGVGRPKGPVIDV